MADIIDDAQAVNELHQELSLREFRAKQGRAPNEFDGTHCTDCGEPIEPPRIALKLWRCIACAVRIELRRKQGMPE